MLHMIKKQVIELVLPPGVDNFRMQQKISDYCHRDIILQLGEIFDGLATDDETVLFDSIEIDLGAISIDEIESGNWKKGFILKLTEYLYKALNATGTRRPIARQQKVITDYRKWVIYMQTGHLPWNSLQTGETWYQNILQTVATEIQAVGELRKIILSNDIALSRIVLQHSEPFLVSLIETITSERQKDLPIALAKLHALFPFASKLPAYSGRSPHFTAANTKQFIKQLWKLVLQVAAREKNISTLALLEKLIAALPIDTQTLVAAQNELGDGYFVLIKPALEKLFPESIIAVKPSGEKMDQAFQKGGEESTGDSKDQNEDASSIKDQQPAEKARGKKELEKDTKDKKDVRAVERDPSAEEKKINERIRDKKLLDEKFLAPEHEAPPSQPLPARADALPPENTVTTPGSEGIEPPIRIPDLFKQQVSETILSEIDEEGIFIQHAGLVLLHPFLHSFLKRVNQVEEGHFINLDAQQRSMHLLHFLATGEQMPEEHVLVIEKVLCAYAIYQPVEREIEISSAEMSEVDNLLEAVLEQWKILQTASGEGLRQGFLQRPGKLYRKGDKLYLQVEAASIDMLLDYLPWNLSMIKLPWMKEVLRVEWR